MIKRLTVFALLLLGAVNAFAENDAYNERVITSSVYVTSGDAVIANHYLSNQEYSGEISGSGARFSAMYKKSSRLSWDLDINYLKSNYSPTAENVSISNPAHTSFYSVLAIDADYGTYCNWNPVKNLYIKAGGSFDILAGMLSGAPDHINNMMDFDLQTQLKACAGIKYEYFFNKFGLSAQAEFAAPFMGVALSSTPYESSVDYLVSEDSDVLVGTGSPFCFTSFHNLKGFNADIEIDVVFKKFTLFYSHNYNYRTWNLRGVSNYRNYALGRLGIKLDLVSINLLKTGNKSF